MGKIRLRDVADITGVSEATVSRVLNERPGVAEDTRRVVLRALGELGYQPTGLSRHTRVGLIGLLVPELENPIFPAFAQAIEQRLAAHGYPVVLGTASPAGMQEDDYVEALLERNATGLVFVSGLHGDTEADPGRYERLVARGVPMVFVNGYLEGVPVPAFDGDERAAFERAVTHLHSLGHERIGCVVGHHRFIGARRKAEGYRRAVAPDVGAELLVESVSSVEGGRLATQQLLDAGATAVVCGSDIMALGALAACDQRGVNVPGDFSVIGCGDAGFLRYARPGLTSLRQPVGTMASAAVESLRDQIAGRDVPTGEILFPLELVVRGSTGKAPSRGAE